MCDVLSQPSGAGGEGQDPNYRKGIRITRTGKVQRLLALIEMEEDESGRDTRRGEESEQCEGMKYSMMLVVYLFQPSGAGARDMTTAQDQYLHCRISATAQAELSSEREVLYSP